MARLLFTAAISGDMKDPARRADLAHVANLGPIAVMAQTHSDVVAQISNADAIVAADALVSTTKGLSIAVMSADCLPILVTSSTCVAAIHAGRLGVGNGIITRTMEVMRTERADSLLATIGPSICGRCYEVSAQMYEEFIVGVPAAATNPDLHRLDLKRAARVELEALGVEVRDLGICTFEQHDYYSFRRDATAHRLAGVVTL